MLCGMELSKVTLEIFSKLEQKWLSHCESGKKTTVLSIDGGGTGAVVSAAALVHLEDQIQFKTGNSHSLIIDFFDVVVGTGVGVVFAAMLTADDGSGRPLFSAKDAVTFVAEKQKQKLRNSATAMAAVTSTSLASRLSTPKAAAPSHSYSPTTQFSGLRQSFSNLDYSPQHLFSPNLRISSLRKPCRGIVAMAGSGKFFVGGNWKCNGTKDSTSKLVSDLNSAKLEADVDAVVAPPFVYLDQVKNSLTDRIEISAQNSWVGKGGAFTGEIRFICLFLLITKKVQSCFTVFKCFKQFSFAFFLVPLKILFLFA